LPRDLDLPPDFRATVTGVGSRQFEPRKRIYGMYCVSCRHRCRRSTAPSETVGLPRAICVAQGRSTQAAAGRQIWAFKLWGKSAIT
jgi:hypothetical protein